MPYVGAPGPCKYGANCRYLHHLERVAHHLERFTHPPAKGDANTDMDLDEYVRRERRMKYSPPVEDGRYRQLPADAGYVQQERAVQEAGERRSLLYMSPPPRDAPVCVYGRQCTVTQLPHITEYRH
jgi:hypothetical protein